MEYRMLGPLEVRVDDGPLSLGGMKQRALLALLLLDANHVVSRERLVDELWGDTPPETAVTTVQVYVSRLRKLLPAETLLTRPPGYLLAVDPADVDLLEFERLCAEARAADAKGAAGLLRDALSLWRGPPLAELGDEPFVRAQRGRLEDRRLAALEERLEADLALGRHAELTGELEALVAEHPHRERLRAHLMLALYRSGRQAEALGAFRDARAALDELGVEPSAALKQLEHRVLTQDAALELRRDRLLSGALGGRIPLPGPLVPSSPFPFVGRREELEIMRSLLQRAERGQGGLVLLAGEAGAGKTRLVRELAEEAVARGTLVLYGASHDVVSVPYQPLREWFEFLLRVCDPEALRACLGGSVLARLVPELERLTGPPLDGEGEADRHLLQGAATESLTRMSGIQPLLVIADNLHWADTETLRLLRRLASIAPEARLLVLAAYRDRGEAVGAELASALAELARLDSATRVAVGGLTDEEVGAFIHASADADVSPELATAVGALTDGTPLLLCELWRDLRESGGVDVSSGSVRVDRPVADVRGSERIRQVVDQRQSRVSPEARAVIETAAVAGPRIQVAVLADAAGLEPAACIARLDEAASAGLLEPLPGPTRSWRFTHELMRRAVYDELDQARCVELHLAVGEAIERSYVADPARALPELAHHFALAASLAGVERALEYNLGAARAAIAAAAYDEAAARFRTALELGIVDPHALAGVQVELGDALLNAGQLHESDTVLERAIEGGRELGDRLLVARARILASQGRLLAHDDDKIASAESAGEEALAVFSEARDERGVAVAWRLLAECRSMESRFRECERLLLEALAHAERAGDRRLVSSILVGLGHARYLGPTPVPEAIVRTREVIDERPAGVIIQAEVAALLAVLEAMRMRFTEARRLCARSRRLFEQLGETFWLAAARFYYGTVELLAGDAVAAERELLAGYRVIEGRGVDAELANLAAALAEAEYAQGRFDEAREHVEVSREASSRDDAFSQSAWRRTGARLLVHEGDLAAAAALAGEAVAIAAATDCLNAHADALLARVEVELAAGASADARASYDEALGLYAAKGNEAAAAQARTTFAGLAPGSEAPVG